MGAADKLAQLGGRDTSGISIAKMVVAAVREDGTVNLAQGESILPGVPCFESYTARKAGDIVTVLRWTGGWCVLGKNGAEPAPPTDTETTVAWGSAAPSGSGWVTGTVYVRDHELYVQTSAPAPPPSPETLKPVTIAPTSQGAWRQGGRDNDQNPSQGAWSSYPYPYTGGWFYGSAVTAACAGKSVSGMTIRVARTGSSHGIFGGVKPRFFLLAASAAGSSPPALGDGPRYGPALGLGSSATWKLPSSWVADLASGAAGGIGISAGVGSDYLVCTGTCGQLTISFS